MPTVSPVAEWVDEHGGWSYTTIVARSPRELDVVPVNAESTAIRWWGLDEVAGLPLHRGFAAVWPRLRALVPVRGD